MSELEDLFEGKKHSKAYKQQIKRQKKEAERQRKAEQAERKRQAEIQRLKRNRELYEAQASERRAKASRKTAGKTKGGKRPSVRRGMHRAERALNPYSGRKHKSIFDW